MLTAWTVTTNNDTAFGLAILQSEVIRDLRTANSCRHCWIDVRKRFNRRKLVDTTLAWRRESLIQFSYHQTWLPTGETPTEAKDKWALSTLNKDRWKRGTQERNEIRKWVRSQWTEDWSRYQEKTPEHRQTPAQKRKLRSDRRNLHQGLRKAESSLTHNWGREK